MQRPREDVERLARQDGEAYTETKAKWALWLWRLYSSNDDAVADDARDQLVAAINHQHARGRKMLRAAQGRFTFTRRVE